MATRRIVYDDQDSTNIQYSGDWFQKSGAQENLGNYGPPYLHTLHGTNHNATVFFEFDGTFVGVYGTSIVSNPKTDPDPNLECFIDGVSIGRDPIFQFPENNWGLCGKSGLSAGPHKLQIDIKVLSPEHTFWLDQIQYTPSPSVPLDNKVIRLANTDPAIRLDDSWGAFGNLKGATKTNAVARVDFIGSSVTWVGYIPKEFPHGSASCTYSIDNDKPVNFDLVGLPGSKNDSQYNQFFFTTPEIENGPHTITVTFLGSQNTTPLTLDRLYIKNGTLFTSASNTSGTAALPNPTTLTHPDFVIGGQSGLNIGALLGGVLGGLGLVLIIIGTFLFRRRRRLSGAKNLHAFMGEPSMYNSQTIFGPNSVPTVPSIPNLKARATHADAHRQLSLVVPLSTKPREASRTAPGPTNSSQDSAGSPPQRRSVLSGAGISYGQVHIDSGIRLNRPLDEDIPPHYTPD